MVEAPRKFYGMTIVHKSNADADSRSAEMVETGTLEATKWTQPG
jgi:hypothetical protein